MHNVDCITSSVSSQHQHAAESIEKNDIKQMFNKDETLSSVTDEEAENVDALVCESNDYFIFIKPKIGTYFEMYCK